MNQILVSKKVYVTPKLKRKKRLYKIQFIISILVVVVLSSYYGYSEYEQRKSERISKDILNNISFSSDQTTVEDDVLVIALNDNASEIPQEVVTEKKNNAVIYTAASGETYTIDAILNIPSLEINYPVLSDTSDELLKISLNKFWGCGPNEVGNYCIVGHNYDGKDILFGKLNRIKNGDIVELEDSSGKKVSYKVYNIFIVDPSDVACTSQLTNGKREMTLITCAEGGRRRLVVKCREA
jgi:LPXTG-site transpeptidase (sortase) family protein